MRGLKYYLTGAVIAVAAFVGYNNFYSTATAHKCSDNNVITCGVNSLGDLRDKYNNDNPDGTQNIFSWFGITKDMVNNGRVVNGLVHKTGIITVDGKTVATDALTAGRQYIPGSTKQVVGGTTFYTRTPSVSFLSSSLEAYVFTDKDGRFLAAVIKECGNPVKGKNTVTPPTHPKVSIDKKVLTDKDLKDPKEHGIVGEDNPFAYRVTVTNTGDVTLKNAVVTDPAPKGVTFTGASLGKVSGNVWSYTIPELAPGKSVTVLIHAVAKEQFLKEVENIACVDAKEITGTKDACDNAWVRTHDRKVTIDKKVNGAENATVEINKPFVYTLVVTNKGDVALADVNVSDKAPDNVLFLEADKGTVAKDQKSWNLTIKSLAPGQSITVKITAKVTKAVKGLKNTACVNAPITEENPDDCDDATIDTPEPKPVLACTGLDVKTISRTEFKFTATREVKNAEYISTRFEIRNAKGEVVATVANVDGAINYTQNNPGTYSVRATIVAKVNGETKTVTSDNCVKQFTVAKPPVETHPAVKIDKKVNGQEHVTVDINKPFTYTITVTNTGDVDLKNVVVTDKPQDGITLVSAAGNLGEIKNNAWTYTIPELKKGTNNAKTFTLTAVVKKYVAGKLVNNACVDAPAVPNGGNPSDDCDDATIGVTKPVVETPGVDIEKYVVLPNGGNAETMPVKVGETFKYRIVVTNTGNTDLKNVVVTDKAPAGVVLLDASAGQVAANGQTWSATTNIAKGKSVTFTLTAKVTVESDSALVNTACVDAPSVPNQTGNNNDACDTANVTTPKTPVEEVVRACNTQTGKIEFVKKGQENVAPYTSDLSKCQVKMCEVPGKEHLPANSPNCKEDEQMCTIDGKENLPANDPACKEDEQPQEDTEETPVELPHTGLSGTVVGLISLGATTAAAAYAVAGRRNN